MHLINLVWSFSYWYNVFVIQGTVYCVIVVRVKAAITDFLGHLGAAETTCKHNF